MEDFYSLERIEVKNSGVEPLKEGYANGLAVIGSSRIFRTSADL
jgi:hypothetical protein